MERLKNCPNCGGYLNDEGRCNFCGSKIYDFVNIDVNNPVKTYIRIRNNGQIITCPVVFASSRLDISIEPDYVTYEYDGGVGVARVLTSSRMTGTVDFYVVGDVITEEGGQNEP